MLVFAEVRMRTGPGFGGAGESVTAAKRARLLAAARLVPLPPARNAVPLRRVPGRRRHRAACNGSATLLANSRAASSGGGRLCAGAKSASAFWCRARRSPASATTPAPSCGTSCASATALELARERDNPHDANAVRGAVARPQARLRAAARERRAGVGPRPRHAAARAHQRARRASEPGASRALRGVRRVKSRAWRDLAEPHFGAFRRKREAEACRGAGDVRAARARHRAAGPRRCAPAARCWRAATAARRPTRSISPPSWSTASSASARRWRRSR